MLFRNKTRCPLGFLVLGAAFSAISLLACSVPVFRYALEHWRADAYQAIVFHRGPLPEAQQTIARDLSREGLAGRSHANVALRIVDLDQDPKPDDLQFWRQLGTDTLPWLAVKYPPVVRSPRPFWSAPLTTLAVQQLLDSPVRQEIARRLAQGESAVWLMLEIGDKSKDDTAAQLVESRLAYLATVLKLPKLEEQDIVNGLVSVTGDDLKLKFSFLRLSRSNPAEQAFVKMLLGTEADLNDISEPIVFPIFGQGRALYALIGKGINHETLDEAASFVIGSCSCQVKDLNPGVDLLLAADWDAAVKASAGSVRNLPAPTDLESAPVTNTISGSSDSGLSASSTSSSPLPRFSVVIALAAGSLLVAGLLLMRRK
jgi:hypothetical protein